WKRKSQLLFLAISGRIDPLPKKNHKGDENILSSFFICRKKEGAKVEQNWCLSEAIIFYRNAGATGDQQLLIELLREVQRENGGTIPQIWISEIADGLGIKYTFLNALIKRYPSLCLEDTP